MQDSIKKPLGIGNRRVYHAEVLVTDKELASALGITKQAVSGMSNKKKKLLLKLGLVYKRKLDTEAGFEYTSLNDL